MPSRVASVRCVIVDSCSSASSSCRSRRDSTSMIGESVRKSGQARDLRPVTYRRDRGEAGSRSIHERRVHELNGWIILDTARHVNAAFEAGTAAATDVPGSPAPARLDLLTAQLLTAQKVPATISGAFRTGMSILTNSFAHSELGVSAGGRPFVSIVLPLYNEAATLPELIHRLRSVAGELGGRYEFEFVCVDDGSVDDTVVVI